MPAQTAKSSLAAKYGGRLDASVKKHAEDPTDYGSGRVPPGINNGIAQLRECYFKVVAPGKQNAGEYYFRAMGVIVEPDSVMTPTGPVTTRGLQTSIMEMVCDTKDRAGKLTTQDQHVENILNEMRKLGGEDFTAGASGAELEALAAALAEAKPFFRFSTSQSAPSKEFPNPRVWENWYGSKGLEEYEPPPDEDAVQDETGGSVQTNGQSAGSAGGTVPRKSPAGGAVRQKTPEPETPDESPPGDLEFGDLDSLVTAAGEADDDGNPTDDAKKAQAELTRLAVEAGNDQATVEAAEDWQAVRDLINPTEDTGGEGATNEPEPEPETPWEPSKGDSVQYRPLDPKTKKPGKTILQVEVVGLDKKARTVTLKNLETGKVLADAKTKKPLSVSFDRVEQSE